jgi:predicted nucleic acid-binding protein
MVAPDLINIEVLSTLRRLHGQRLLSPERAGEAVADLIAAPLRRLGTLSLVGAIWRRRSNLSAYDACYVALAEALDCTLVSGDVRLARAPALPIRIVVP